MCELDERALTQSKPMHIIDIQHTEKFFNNLKNGIDFEQERILFESPLLGCHKKVCIASIGYYMHCLPFPARTFSMGDES